MDRNPGPDNCFWHYRWTANPDPGDWNLVFGLRFDLHLVTLNVELSDLCSESSMMKLRVTSRRICLSGELSVEVRQSQIEGLGLYARQTYEPGEVVLSWDLSHTIDNDQLLTLPESERRYTHPLDDYRTLIVQPPER